MAFPDDYEENVGRCMGQYKDHRWLTTGHPLRHRCADCHQLRWKEVKREQKVTKPYVMPIISGKF